MEKNDLKLFSGVLKLIYGNDLAGALDIILPYLTLHPYVLYSEDVDNIQKSFRMMLHYKELGVDDEMRGDMYSKMLERLKNILRNMRADYRRRNVDFYKDAVARSGVHKYSFSESAIKFRLEDYVSDLAMLQLEPADKQKEISEKLYLEHFSFLQALFCHIVVDDLWTQEQASDFAEILLSPTIDVADAQFLVSAVMLAAMNNFDINKFSILVRVYSESNNETLRQKALVAWVLSMTDVADVEKQRQLLKPLLDDENVVKELVDMQKQMIFCMNAETDNDIIQRDIMPTLIKNSDISVSRFGLTDNGDNIRDILDPGAEDRAMEEMEDKFQRMQEMQQGGADIYFGGFSHMKRFPFFYSLPNWFFPFNINHPDLAKSREGLRNNKFLNNLMHSGPFCDSDKYSFALAVVSVIDKLPADVLEVMNNGELPNVVGGSADTSQSAYIRRMALQDLYRFFRLYRWHEQIYNPFTKDNSLFITNRLLKGTKVDGHLEELGYFLMSRKKDVALTKLISVLPSEMTVKSALLKGVYSLELSGDYRSAADCFQFAVDKDPENVKAMAGLAKSLFKLGDLSRACSVYKNLCSANPDNKSWALGLAVIYARTEEYEEASKILYELDFKHPGSPNVKRVLAWILMEQAKFEQADKLYKWLLDKEKVEDMDFLNSGYCKCFMNDISDATGLFAEFCKRRTDDYAHNGLGYSQLSLLLDREFSNDSNLLAKFGVTDVDKMLMKRLAYERLINS